MNGVNVIAAMRNAAKELRHWSRDHGEDIATMTALAELADARAAVNELIEAARSTSVIVRVSGLNCIRLDAAIARAEGGAP